MTVNFRMESAWHCLYPGWSLPEQKTRLEMQHWDCLQEETKQTQLLKDTQILQSFQQYVAYFLNVCSGERNLLCSHLLGQQLQSQRLKETKQIDKECWLCAGEASSPLLQQRMVPAHNNNAAQYFIIQLNWIQFNPIHSRKPFKGPLHQEHWP